MGSLDLGKQVGPLPLGAWFAVVGAGLGVAYYTRKQSSGASEPVVVEDTSGTPGVGTGVNGMWTDVTPQPPPNAPTVYTDNDSWGRAAIDRLVADGYQPAQVYSAITKALAGGAGDNKLSTSEYAIWARALFLLKTPPTPVGVPAPSPTPTPTPTPAKKYKMVWLSSKVVLPNETIRIKQRRYATEAFNAHVWAPSQASLNSVIAQAAVRSAVSPDTKLKPGRWVVLYRMVPA